jgi:hypothetical protein
MYSTQQQINDIVKFATQMLSLSAVFGMVGNVFGIPSTGSTIALMPQTKSQLYDRLVITDDEVELVRGPVTEIIYPAKIYVRFKNAETLDTFDVPLDFVARFNVSEPLSDYMFNQIKQEYKAYKERYGRW